MSYRTIWCHLLNSNQQPLPYHGTALPLELKWHWGKYWELNSNQQSHNLLCYLYTIFTISYYILIITYIFKKIKFFVIYYYGGATATRTRIALNTLDALAGHWDTITPWLHVCFNKGEKETKWLRKLLLDWSFTF